MRRLIAAYCVFFLGNLIRTFRFIQLDYTDNKLSHWWNINAFYNFITSTLPGGTGEAATAYVLKRYSNFNILGALRILLLSRLMDISALSALFFIAAIMMHSDTSYREAAIWLSGTLFLISSITLLRSSEQFVMRLLQKLPGQSPLIKRVCEKLSELLNISEKQRSNNSSGMTLFLSTLIAIGSATVLHMILQSLGVDFTPAQSVYCYGIYLMFQVIPIQGIAGLGTQAAWWAFALNAAGYKTPDAIAMGFILYGVFYFIVAVLGLFSMLFWLKGKR